jgi:hypothetical protein
VFRAVSISEGSGSAAAAYERIRVYGRPCRDTGSWISVYAWDFVIQPRTIWDNLDAMTQLEVVMCQSNGANVFMNGSGTIQAPGSQFFVPMPDRQYANATDNNVANAVRVTHTILTDCNPLQYTQAQPWCGNGYLKIRAYNAYGFSPWRGFGPGPNDLTTPLPYTSGIAAGSSGGGGGSTSGGSCVSPEALVLLADGREVPAGKIGLGDMVLTVADGQEAAPSWGAYEVVAMQVVQSPRRIVIFDDRTHLVASPGHRVLLDGGRGYQPVSDLRGGERIMGAPSRSVLRVERHPAGPVVKLTVKGAHTYVSNGVLSHNRKIL